MNSETQRFGLRYEQWAANYLNNNGFSCELVSNYFADFDILLTHSGLEIEVKAARGKPYRNGAGRWGLRWQWNTARGLRNTHDYIYMLIAVDQNERPWPFIVPSAYIGLRGCLTPSITSHPEKYRGWMKSCLYALSNIHFIIGVRNRLNYQQLPLFSHQKESAYEI